ncbi:CRP-like cAMP-binding protein [Pedobacter africanus]|uniref:CRP-like cAMP-binding protein n=1 Tax=Pedobacter africanus TaxID=151894 RepID=A0ACC6KSY6_9SPHI|nr:Crp/Fnr family transcriptional regulator [Pedobacter africanus]MDR6782331.1 CRP-like cAMP-binding protein [Pedobacter africanus]
MTNFKNELNGERLERIIRKEIMPKLEAHGGEQSEEFITRFIKRSKLRPFAKDQYLEESRDFADGKLFYLISGIARTVYYPTANDKPVIPRIWKKGEVIFDVNSFKNETERIESIQMLEEGEAITISYDSIKELLKDFPNMVSFLLCLQAERENYSRYYQRLLKLAAEESVAMYLQDNPGIEHRINKDIIALYLGISRSKFSSAYTLYKQKLQLFFI